MREILFKAKLVDNGKWVEGDLITYGNNRSIRVFDDSGDFPRYYEVIVIPETVCQFTGLTDKNRKKIWDKSILFPNWCFRKMPSRGHLNKKYPTIIKGYAVVEFNGGEFEFKFLKPIIEHKEAYEKNMQTYAYVGYTRDSFNIEQTHVEVVGNIFDNPELLK